MKVGRSALDEIAIKSIEESNPDIEFDWTRILKEGGPEPAGQAQRTPTVERRGPRRPLEPRGARPGAEPRANQAPSRPEPTDSATDRVAVQSDQPAETSEELPVAAVDQAVTIEPEPPAAIAMTPAHVRLGSESVLRLRARHAEILARISERIPEPARQEELKAQADRLNPDTWVTDGEVSAGLEGYETVLESLRAVVGQGRRRRRRGGQPREGTPAGEGTPTSRTAIESGTPAASAESQDDDAEPEEEPV